MNDRDHLEAVCVEAVCVELRDEELAEVSGGRDRVFDFMEKYGERIGAADPRILLPF
jgi:hypothetical protein